MAKSKGGKETRLTSPLGTVKTTKTPTTTTNVTTPVSTKHGAPAVPLQIPNSKKEASHPPKRPSRRSTRPRDVCSPNAVPPSVHALLASTAIPRQKSTRATASERSRPPTERIRSQEKEKERSEGLTLDAVLGRTQDPEKELSLSLCKSPLDVLLSSPEELDDDEEDTSTSFSGSFLSSSTRTVSVDGSAPSLAACSSSPRCASLTDDSSVTSPCSFRRKRTSSILVNRRFEPVSPSHSGAAGTHPLSAHPLSAQVSVDELDFRVFQPPDEAASRWDAFSSLPLRSAFKSNLTASLRVLRSAARSFSSMSLASIPADDFLTRSILTLDPGVPFTDERRPPMLEEEPSEELRRYLNPITRPLVEDGPMPRRYAASIQMQTYKIEKLRENARAAKLPVPVTPRTPVPGSEEPERKAVPVGPVMRQREVRENPDFIRIAVLEMAMRRKGKLDDQRPGRARWALPARKAGAKEYEVGEDGVPARWVPIEG